MEIRPYRATDAPTLARIFHAGVQQGAAGHYTQVERDAWSPGVPDTEQWQKRLAGLMTLVADGDEGPEGFMALRDDGYLDFAYVRPDRRGSGMADLLLKAIVAMAQARGLTRLTTEASLVARSFFARNGWRQVSQQQVQRRGVDLTNFVMRYEISTPVR